MSRQLDRARERLARADRYLHGIKLVFAIYVVIISALLVFQLYELQLGQADQLKQAQDSLSKSLADNKAQHQKTQAYIRCIALALLKPVAQRDASAFDSCGIDASNSADSKKQLATPNSAASSNPVTPKATTTTESPAAQQQTTSSPPDPSTSSVLQTQLKALLSPVTNALTQGR